MVYMEFWPLGDSRDWKQIKNKSFNKIRRLSIQFNVNPVPVLYYLELGLIGV